MWKNLVQSYQEFRELEAGERFLKTHEFWRERANGPYVSAILLGLGILLVVAGFLLGLVPGVPGVVLGVLGLALIATRFRRLAVWLDWCELKVRRLWRRLRRAGSHR